MVLLGDGGVDVAVRQGIFGEVDELRLRQGCPSGDSPSLAPRVKDHSVHGAALVVGVDIVGALACLVIE